MERKESLNRKQKILEITKITKFIKSFVAFLEDPLIFLFKLLKLFSSNFAYFFSTFSILIRYQHVSYSLEMRQCKRKLFPHFHVLRVLTRYNVRILNLSSQKFRETVMKIITKLVILIKIRKYQKSIRFY